MIIKEERILSKNISSVAKDVICVERWVILLESVDLKMLIVAEITIEATEITLDLAQDQKTERKEGEEAQVRAVKNKEAAIKERKRRRTGLEIKTRRKRKNIKNVAILLTIQDHD